MFYDAAQNEVSLDVVQAGAICYRRDRKGHLEVPLVGSRRNGRWGLPKGHIEIREQSSAAALGEAVEEAGIIGAIDSTPFGSFTYQKVASKLPVKGIRKTWFLLKDAVCDAAQPSFRTLLSRLETVGV